MRLHIHLWLVCVTTFIEIPIDMRSSDQWLWAWRGLHVDLRASHVTKRIRLLREKYPRHEYQMTVIDGTIESDMKWHVKLSCKDMSDPTDVGTVFSVPAEYLIASDKKQATAPTGPPIFSYKFASGIPQNDGGNDTSEHSNEEGDTDGWSEIEDSDISDMINDDLADDDLDVMNKNGVNLQVRA